MSNWRIPLSDLDYGPEEQAAVARVLNSKWLSMGPEVEAFEREFAEFTGAKRAFGVANGTAALHLAFLAAGLGPGDEIIQPAINFVATANMSVAVGATPVFADILDLAEPTVAPAEIERLITPRTKAVVVMHYGGYLCRMTEILEICRQRNLIVIEDACHAVGAAGLLGDISCFSFFSNKNLATGEGGMLVTNRDDIAQKVRSLRSHGMTTLTWDRHKGHASSYDVTLHGYNYRLDELRAALGRAQLKKLTRNNARRRELVLAYRAALANSGEWIVPFASDAGDSAYHLMTVVPQDTGTRTAAVRRLNEHGIQTSLHYPCIPGFEAFKRFASGDCKKSFDYASRTITLPLFPTMSQEQVVEICALLSDA